MILRELFYFDRETIEPVEDKQYDPQYDHSPVDFNSTRKTRLTLGQINRARLASEIHTEEQEKELHFVRQMYGLAANAEAGGA
jgi:hypothetical protein